MKNLVLNSYDASKNCAVNQTRIYQGCSPRSHLRVLFLSGKPFFSLPPPFLSTPNTPFPLSASSREKTPRELKTAQAGTLPECRSPLGVDAVFRGFSRVFFFLRGETVVSALLFESDDLSLVAKFDA